MSFRPANPYSKIERDMLALGMKAMVRAWVTKAGMDRYDRAYFGGSNGGGGGRPLTPRRSAKRCASRLGVPMQSTS